MLSFLRAQLRSTREVIAGFKGNARALLICEPLWGIPYNLYATYASVYMLALGCTETQVGLIASCALVSAIVFSLVGGWIIDRMGRKRATLFFDILSWSIPGVLLATSRGFTMFLLAALINSLVRVVNISWDCLMVEDTPPAQRVHFYTWIAVAGILAGFISPVSGPVVDRFGLVPAMRALYAFAAISMTVMFFWRNSMTHETEIGAMKMRETRHGDAGTTASEYARITGQLLRNPLTLTALVLNLLLTIQMTLKGTFLSIQLNRRLGFSAGSNSIFPAINSAVVLLVYSLAMPAVGRMKIHRPLAFGLVCSALSFLLLAASPSRSMPFVIASTILGALGGSIAGPLSAALVANSVADADRAKVMSLFNALVIAACSPFGYVGGLLSTVSERLPFVLGTATFVPTIALAIVLPVIQRRYARKVESAAA